MIPCAGASQASCPLRSSTPTSAHWFTLTLETAPFSQVAVSWPKLSSCTGLQVDDQGPPAKCGTRVLSVRLQGNEARQTGGLA